MIGEQAMTRNNPVRAIAAFGREFSARRGALAALLPASVKPKIVSDRPRPVSRKPVTSRGRLTASRMFGTSRVANSRPMMPIGIISQKMPRQW